jgi:Dolichyl-phosphate-mannose-protein mannosyltransferase
MSLVQLLQLAVVAWLPGAVIFRLPLAGRDKRAAIDAEERLFWNVVISLSVSLSVVVALAAAHRYTFRRLLIVDVGIAVALAAAARFRLRLGTQARRPGLSIVLPLVLVALGAWRFFPPSEYIIGGKDPGVYVNEGIQIAQRGTFVYTDPAVAAVPLFARDLFFPSHQRPDYYGTRFMGFFVMNPDTGTVVGQFPHVFPAAIAIGYGLNGLTGVRETVGLWAILGLVAVYFAGRRVAGQTGAFAAAVLLGLHVIEVWFARYPNAEVVMQALLFAAILASARAHADEDPFFAPVAGMLLGLLIFLRIDTALGIAGVLGGLVLHAMTGRRLYASFFVTLGCAGLLALPYFFGPMRAYIHLPLVFLTNLRWFHYAALTAGAAAAVLGLVAVRRWPAASRRAAALVPLALSAVLAVAAVYAMYFREPAGKLAPHDAYSLRSYTALYATLPAVAAALIGVVVAARRTFWRAPELFVTVTAVSLFLFYKIRIVPEHFWMTRRFLAVILPGMLIFACAAATAGLYQRGIRRVLSGAIGAAFIVLLGRHYAAASRPLIEHVEYAGIIGHMEQLAGQIGADDLLLVESRDAGSDAHVMALPLAYIYARNVLVLASVRPEAGTFGRFIDWARGRYAHVYFLGGGGTELLSRRWSATAVSSDRFQVPEYESTVNAYPRFVRRKEFDFGLYELLPAANDVDTPFDLDVGIRDDLNVVRFHAKEVADGRTMRWSQRQSFVSLPKVAATSREVVIVMSSGGRPEAAPPAEVSVFLDERPLGTARVGNGFAPYAFRIPPEIAEQAARADQPARLRLVTPVWNPHEVIGSADDRELGVMVDRVQVR